MAEPVSWPTRDLLSHRAGTTPERTALVDADTGRTVTYRSLDAEVDSVAAVLADRAGGGTVATLMDTRPAIGRLLFGTMRSGATLAPLNPELDAETLRAQLAAVGADLLVCERGTEERAAGIAECPVSSVDEPTTPGTTPMAATDDETAVEPATLRRDETALVLFTSGTTSDPKGVRLTVGNLVASATASAFRLGVTPGDRWLVSLAITWAGWRRSSGVCSTGPRSSSSGRSSRPRRPP